MTTHWPPRVGDIVHYVSHGTPPRPDGTQAYPSVCRAAVVTETDPMDPYTVGLCVLNPTGQFFNRFVAHDPGDPDQQTPAGAALCHTGTRHYQSGTWHAPEADHDD